jgi:hypothetical protein
MIRVRIYHALANARTLTLVIIADLLMDTQIVSVSPFLHSCDTQ